MAQPRLCAQDARGLIFQVLLVVALALLGYEIVSNTIANLQKQNLASGFGFLEQDVGLRHLADADPL